MTDHDDALYYHAMNASGMSQICQCLLGSLTDLVEMCLMFSIRSVTATLLFIGSVDTYLAKISPQI